MTTAAQYTLNSEQIKAWLRGLLTIAWVDGDFDPHEKELIASVTREELAPGIDFDNLETITPEELVAVLGKGTKIAENFLRTAVMVAISDGTYSPKEDELLHKLCQSLGEPTTIENILNALRQTLENKEKIPNATLEATKHHLEPLQPLRQWLDDLEIHDPRIARFLCKMIPSQCPFERDVVLFGHKIVHIPPLCKLNPLYEQLVGLRFRALSYLADDCREDVSQYI